MAIFYHNYVTIEYIDPATWHNFAQLIPGVNTFSSNDLVTPLSLDKT